jgi:uncharacterized protein YodC (DUF2158 family)
MTWATDDHSFWLNLKTSDVIRLGFGGPTCIIVDRGHNCDRVGVIDENGKVMIIYVTRDDIILR